jgi:hypothetical protein
MHRLSVRVNSFVVSILVALIATLIGYGTAIAFPVTISFSGVTTPSASLESQPLLDIAKGTPVSGIITYDPGLVTLHHQTTWEVDLFGVKYSYVESAFTNFDSSGNLAHGGTVTFTIEGNDPVSLPISMIFLTNFPSGTPIVPGAITLDRMIIQFARSQFEPVSGFLDLYFENTSLENLLPTEVPPLASVAYESGTPGHPMTSLSVLTI